MADQRLAAQLWAARAEAEPAPRSAEERRADEEERKARQDTRNEAYAEERVPRFIGILIQKAEAANKEKQTKASIEMEVDVAVRPELRYTFGLVGAHFEAEGFAVTHRERDNSTQGHEIRGGDDWAPGRPATQFTAELTIDWSQPPQEG